MVVGVHESSYFILAALIGAPRHGYGIIQEARSLSGERVRLTAGTLYGALDRLTNEGLVVPDREETVAGRRRRYYRLTAAGADLLAGEAERRRTSAAVVEARLAAPTRLREIAT